MSAITVGELYRRRGTGQHWLVVMARHCLGKATRYVCFRDGKRLDLTEADLLSCQVPKPSAPDPGVRGWDY